MEVYRNFVQITEVAVHSLVSPTFFNRHKKTKPVILSADGLVVVAGAGLFGFTTS